MTVGGSNDRPRTLRGLVALVLLSAYAAALVADDAARPPLTWPAAQTRLLVTATVAKERGAEEALADKLRDAYRSTKQWIEAGNPYRADDIIASLEAAVGLDRGAKTMGGVPVYQPTPEMAQQLEQLEDRLDKAMRDKDAKTIARIIATMRRIMDDQAGMPVMANAGWRVDDRSVSQAEAVDLFLGAVAAEKQKFALVANATPLPETRVRYYAEVAIACSEIRDLVQKHRPKYRPEVDKIVSGACTLLLTLQQPGGHFPLPDPRNKLKWNTGVDEDGGTQLETGEAGVALLIAGIEYANAEWLAGGLQAADWAIAQPCVRNFSYNAQSIYLLATAHKLTRNKKYLTAAIEKWNIGLSPGLLPTTGRWIDPHNARTAYHLINLRALTELALVVPRGTDDYADLRAVLSRAAKLATRGTLDEFEKYGVTNTSYAMPALWRARKLDPQIDPRMGVMLPRTIAATLAASMRDGQPNFGSSPAALATVARVVP